MRDPGTRRSRILSIHGVRSPHWPARARALAGGHPPRPRRTGRADIQGLRALAVGLVIANHVFDQPSGGFVGVDVFFVLSGFLITHLLLSEHGREGRISYLDFYRRRVRRIVPAATVVILVTVAATYLVFSGTRGGEVAQDGAFAFVFAANWHFAESGTNYFASGGPVSPLQHYWSLSIEEQFYLVWPTVLVVALLLARRVRPVGRGPRRDRVVLGVVGGTLAVASLAYSLVHSSSSPVAAYFSTFDRAWELLVGGLVAVSVPVWKQLTARARTVLAWTGLVAIVASVALIDEGSAFPAPWALLPVLGTALVVVAGVGTEPRHFGILRNRVTNYVGDISYSLYLWHFPVVVVLLAYFPDAGVVYQLVALALTLTLSVLSYHLVEQPVRDSSWLEPVQRKIARRGPVDHSHRLANGWMAVGVAVLVVLVAAVVVPQRGDEGGDRLLTAAPVPATGVQSTADEEPTDGGAAEAYLQKRIQQSLDLDSFPALVPGVDALGLQNWFEDMEDYGCVAVSSANVDDCSFGPQDAPTTTVVIGDSIAIAYMPTVREALPTGRVQQLTLQECPPYDGVATDRLEGGPFPECDAFKPYALRQVDKLDPDLVLLSSTTSYPQGALKSGATGTEGLAEVADGLKREIEAVSAPGRIVAVVSSPPTSGDLTECVTKVGSPDDCEQPVSPDWYTYTDMERETAEAAGAAYIDTQDWFCADGVCPGFVGATPTFVDGEHLSLAYAQQLAPVMRDALVEVVAEEQPQA